MEYCQTLDKNNYYLQFGDEKPTMYVRYVVVKKLIEMEVSSILQGVPTKNLPLGI